MNTRKALLSSLLIAPVAAFAAGATAKAPSPDHFFAGVNVGAAHNSAELSALYDSTLNREAYFENTAASSGMLAGIDLGYDMSLGGGKNIAFTFGINANTAALKQSMHLDTGVTHSAEAFDMIQSFEPKMQYNLMLSYGYAVTPSFSSHVNVGASFMVVDHTLQIHDTGQTDADDLAAEDVSDTNSLTGGLIGFGSSMNMGSGEIHWDMNYYMYGSQKLDDVTDVDAGANATDNLSERKAVLTMPAFTVGYHFNF